MYIVCVLVKDAVLFPYVFLIPPPAIFTASIVISLDFKQSGILGASVIWCSVSLHKALQTRFTERWGYFELFICKIFLDLFTANGRISFMVWPNVFYS